MSKAKNALEWEDTERGYSALSIYPFLWTSGPPVGERSRRAVPIEEIWGLTQQFQASLGGRAE